MARVSFSNSTKNMTKGVQVHDEEKMERFDSGAAVWTWHS